MCPMEAIRIVVRFFGHSVAALIDELNAATASGPE